MTTIPFDEYDERIKFSLDAAYAFFKAHKRPRDANDWDRIDLALNDYRDVFTSDLIMAVVDELQKESDHAKKRKSLDIQSNTREEDKP